MHRDYQLYAVLTHEIDKIWSKVEPFLSDATQFSDGTFLASDIYENLKKQHMQLWVVALGSEILCAVITQVFIYPRQRRLAILFMGGIGMDKWLHLIEPIMQWGRDLGCSCVQVYGRPGWERALKDYGFKKIHVVLKADL